MGNLLVVRVNVCWPSLVMKRAPYRMSLTIPNPLLLPILRSSSPFCCFTICYPYVIHLLAFCQTGSDVHFAAKRKTLAYYSVSCVFYGLSFENLSWLWKTACFVDDLPLDIMIFHFANSQITRVPCVYNPHKLIDEK